MLKHLDAATLKLCAVLVFISPPAIAGEQMFTFDKILSNRSIDWSEIPAEDLPSQDSICASGAICTITLRVLKDGADPDLCTIGAIKTIFAVGGSVVKWNVEGEYAAGMRYKFHVKRGIKFKKDSILDFPFKDPQNDFKISDYSTTMKVKAGIEEKPATTFYYSIAIEGEQGICGFVDPVVINRN